MEKVVEHKSSRLKPFVSLDRALFLTEAGLNILAGFIVMLMMFFATAEIIGRYVFNHPLRGHMEIMQIFLVLVVFFGIAYTESADGHIGVDVVIKKISERPRRVIELILYLLSIIILGFLVKYTLDFALLSIKFQDATEYIRFPYWPSKLAVVIGLALLSIRLIIKFVKNLNRSLGRRQSSG